MVFSVSLYSEKLLPVWFMGKARKVIKEKKVSCVMLNVESHVLRNVENVKIISSFRQYYGFFFSSIPREVILANLIIEKNIIIKT